MSQPSLPLRSRIEHKAYPVLKRFNALPRPVVFLGVLVLVVAGLVVPVVGWVLLAVVALFVALLVWSTWPQTTPPERLMRLAVLAIAVALTLVRAFPRS